MRNNRFCDTVYHPVVGKIRKLPDLKATVIVAAPVAELQILYAYYVTSWIRKLECFYENIYFYRYLGTNIVPFVV